MVSGAALVSDQVLQLILERLIAIQLLQYTETPLEEQTCSEKSSC